MCANCSRRGPSLVGAARPKSRIRHYARRSLRWPPGSSMRIWAVRCTRSVCHCRPRQTRRCADMVATKHANRWFLLYGFGKNEQGNIDDRELAALQKLANALLAMTSAQLEHAVV